jgi:hypothetical protein
MADKHTQAQQALARPRPTAQGVNAKASKQDLVDVARRLAISRPDRLNKTQLVEEIERANRRATERARGPGSAGPDRGAGSGPGRP